MATRRYTREELLALRSSPLVHKPEDLPAIEQWIDESLQQQQTSTNTKRQPLAKIAAPGGDASPMGSFSTGARPGLISRTTGSKSGEDISLGPPKTMFPSSRNTPRPSDAGLTSSNQATGDEQDGARNRFLGERTNRRSMAEREGRDTRDSWTIVREKRALGGNDDEHRQDNRNHRRDRDQDGERRNGHGERQEGRWGERRQNGDRQGGWRDRQGGDRDRRDRDWDRGAGAEKAPEWMDDPAPPGGDDDLQSMGMPRNQEQFQKWKEAMSGKKAPVEAPEPEPTPPPKEIEPANPMTTLKLEGVTDKPFGSWGESKSSGSAADSSSKPSAMKGKPSRFASMFKVASPKDEEPFADPPPPAPAPPTNSAEDAAGFQRIMQMLGGTNITQAPAPETPSSPPGRTTSGGSKQKSRFTGFFDQTPKSPERMQSPPEDAFYRNQVEMPRDNRNTSEDNRNMFVGRLPDNQHEERARRDQMPGNAISPEPPMNGSREQGPHGRMNDIFLDGQQKPPSRGPATPDINIQNLLAAQRAQKSQAQDKNSQFLLNLLQEKGSNSASQQAQQAQQARQDGFPLWLDQPPSMPQEPHAPKPRGAPPPPGFIDGQLLRSGHGDRSRQEQPGMAEQRSSQRAPPGFYDEQAMYFQQQQQQQQQRRNFADQPQQHPQQQGPGGPGHTRRMSNHPMPPQMHMPPMHQFPPQGPPPPDFLQSPQGPPGAGGQPPPPGFNPHLARHPPGFHGPPGMFQQPPPPQPPPQQRGDFQGGMVSPPPNVPPGFYAGPPGMHHPPPPPPPPGFMGMRNPNEGVPSRGYEGHDGGMGPRR